MGSAAQKMSTLPDDKTPPCAAFDAGILERTPLFGGMTEDFRCVLTDRMEIRPCPQGTFVYREGEPGRELFIVASGQMEVRRGETLMSRLGPGDFFGECSFLDMQPRGTTVRAVEEAQVYVIPYTALRNLYQVNVRMYALIVMNLAREMSRRLRGSYSLMCAEPKDHS
jgi:CRP-like cAMP-binding protein